MLRVCEKASFAKQARHGAISRFSFLFLFPFRLSLLAFSSEYIDELLLSIISVFGLGMNPWQKAWEATAVLLQDARLD